MKSIESPEQGADQSPAPASNCSSKEASVISSSTARQTRGAKSRYRMFGYIDHESDGVVQTLSNN